MQVGKEEVKVSLFEDDMIVYLNDHKKPTRELLQLINNLVKVAGHKINSNKSVAFLYSKDKQAEKEIGEMTPFTICLLYTSPSPRDLSTSRMPSSA